MKEIVREKFSVGCSIVKNGEVLLYIVFGLWR